MDREAAKKALQSAKATGFFTEMYGDGAAENEKRYEHVLEGFEKSFGGDQVSLFTSCLLYTSSVWGKISGVGGLCGLFLSREL